MTSILCRVSAFGVSKEGMLDPTKITFALLKDWIYRRMDELPTEWELLMVKWRDGNDKEVPLENQDAWEACLIYGRSLKNVFPLELLVMERPREEPVLSKKFGIGNISRKIERANNREFVRYSTRLALEVERKAKVEAEAHLLQDLFTADTDDETFVRVCVNGVIPSLAISRVPINLILLIDRSASMKGAGLDAAKNAALAAAASLQAGDQLTVIAFDSSAQAVVPTFTKGAEEGRMKEVEGAIRKLEAAGGTNMQNALMLASQGARDAFSASKTNRVMLVTDGKPNKLDGLLEAVGDLSKLGICTTTLGVGDDFDEDLLAKVASLGMGSHYWVKNGDQMVEVMKKEIADLALVVGRQCRVILTPCPGVSVVEVYGYTSGISPLGETIVEVGDVISNAAQDILVRLSYSLPPGEQKLLDVRTTYLDSNTKSQVSTSALTATFTRNSAELVATMPVGVVVEKVAKVHAARAMKLALEKLRGGDITGALAVLDMEATDQVVRSSSMNPKARATSNRLAGELEFYGKQNTRGELDANALRKELAIRVADLEKR